MRNITFFSILPLFAILILFGCKTDGNSDQSDHKKLTIPESKTQLADNSVGWDQDPNMVVPVNIEGGSVLQQIQNELRHVADVVLPSVVRISVEQEVPAMSFFDFFKLPPQRREGLGSGVIVQKEGNKVFILTNFHVVEGADTVKVKGISGKEETDAEIVGSDPELDLALLEVETDEDVTLAQIANSDDVRVGDWAIAVGNPFGLDGTFTVGFVSAVEREGIQGFGGAALQSFIQTDAAINPGNSGGPLVNIEGKVIGITTQIFSRTGGNIGLGFAVSINQAVNFVNQIREHGTVQRGFLGILVQDINEEAKEGLGLKADTGALVVNVTKDSPADVAGIKVGDVITKVDEKEIDDSTELVRNIASLAPGESVKIYVNREGDNKSFEVELGTRPSSFSENQRTSNHWGIEIGNITQQDRNTFDIPTNKEGVIVRSIEKNSPAASRLEPGDVILKVNQHSVTDVASFNKTIKELENNVVYFTILRDGRASIVQITFSERK